MLARGPNLETSSTFLICLIEGTGNHLNDETLCRAAGLSTQSFLRNMVVQDGQRLEPSPLIYVYSDI